MSKTPSKTASKKKATKTPAEECVEEIRDALSTLSDNRSLSIAQYVDALEEVQRETESEIEMLLDAARSDLTSVKGR